MIATQLSLAIYQFIDALMVKSLGPEPLAAIGPAGMTLQIPLAFGTGLLAAVTTFVSNSQGGGSRYLSALYGWLGLIIGLVFGVLFLALYPVSGSLLGFVPQEVGVLRHSVDYFEISLFSIAPQLVVAGASSYFLGVDRPMLPFLAVLLSSVANLVFNYGLIFGNFGFPEMGLRGAALGTVGGTIIGMIFILVCFGRERLTLPWKIRFRSHVVIRFLRVGVPTGFHHALDIVAWGYVLLFFIGQYGTSDLAAATVVLRCVQLSYLPTHGVGIAMTAMVANGIGRGDYDGVEATVKSAFRILGVYMSGMGVVFVLGRHHIMDLFSSGIAEHDDKMLVVGAHALIVVGIAQVFDALYIVYSDSLRGAGDTVWQSVVNFIYCIVIFIGGCWAVSTFWPQGGSVGLWIVDGLYVTTQGVTCYLRWRSGIWRSGGFISLDLGNVDDIPPRML